MYVCISIYIYICIHKALYLREHGNIHGNTSLHALASLVMSREFEPSPPLQTKKPKSRKSESWGAALKQPIRKIQDA